MKEAAAGRFLFDVIITGLIGVFAVGQAGASAEPVKSQAFMCTNDRDRSMNYEYLQLDPGPKILLWPNMIIANNQPNEEGRSIWRIESTQALIHFYTVGVPRNQAMDGRFDRAEQTLVLAGLGWQDGGYHCRKTRVDRCSYASAGMAGTCAR